MYLHTYAIYHYVLNGIYRTKRHNVHRFKDKVYAFKMVILIIKYKKQYQTACAFTVNITEKRGRNII